MSKYGVWVVGMLLGNLAFSKAGLVNMQKVILNVTEGKTARAALEEKIKAKEKEFTEKKQALDTMQKEWQDKAALLNDEARFKKQQEFQEKFVEMRNLEMTFQNQIKQEEMEATQKIAIQVQKLVDGMAKEQNLDVVYETSSSGLLYVKDPVELTDKVITAYDKALPAGKAATLPSKVMDLSKNTTPEKSVKK